MAPDTASPPAKNQSKSPLPVPALYRDEGESEVESDDALDRPRSPHDEHQPMEVDVDAEGESDVADSDHDADSKTAPGPPVPRVVFDDDGESEMEEPESEEEPDVPLSTVQKSKPASSSQGTFLHVSHKIFPNHSRPFGELAASTSTTARSKDHPTDAPFVPYARAPPTPPTHAAFQRSWLVPNPHIMHVKRRDQSMLESSSTHTHTHDGHPHPHPHHRTLLPELRPKEVPQQYPYLIPRTPMPQERRPPRRAQGPPQTLPVSLPRLPAGVSLAEG